MTEQYAGFTSRAALWKELQQGGETWDVVIVGGGIIGAGVLREADRRGLRALLVEQKDFSWGTSSRSSKMIHGGLRYLGSGDIKMTRESLSERERLLREAPGLIERMGYFFTLRKWKFPGRIPFGILLSIYDRMAGIRNHRFFDRAAVEEKYPGIDAHALSGAMYYTDTVTDDARLVLRILQESIAAGGCALNYVRVTSLLKEGGQVSGVVLEDMESGERVEVASKFVISATGAWADRLRNEVNPEKRIRPLRGSHLVLPSNRLPVNEALTLLHPVDKRPVFIFPWEGTTVVGTTDLDHSKDLNEEPTISREELDYLLGIVRAQFPGHDITSDDIISTWSGIRPVIGSEKSKDPSKERRDHAVWKDGNLVTVSGGKLTTFRLIALDAINAVDASSEKEPSDTVFAPLTLTAEQLPVADKVWARRLLGRYGAHANTLLEACDEREHEPVAGTHFCLAECRWAARNEAVVHLDDLLLRRTRLGCVLDNGGEAILPQLQEICSEELGWSADKWQAEVARYRALWRAHYYLPESQSGP